MSSYAFFSVEIVYKMKKLANDYNIRWHGFTSAKPSFEIDRRLVIHVTTFPGKIN